MKRFMLLLLGAMITCATSAQVLEEGELVLVYYSPKTTISLDFEYTVETYEAGIYAAYAETMLGTTDAVMENKKVYTLKDVHICTQTTTDYTRPHKVAAEAGFPMLLNINDKGILTGYNIPMPEKSKTIKTHESNYKSGKQPAAKSQLPPYSEDVLKAATPEAQAYEVAKQIFHLRETRMYLINGEVEHAPADGKAMELVLAETERQERALTELFVGKKSKKTEHKKTSFANICRQGTEANNIIRQNMYFSEENGFTNGDNIDADKIAITIHLTMAEYKAATEAADPKKNKNKGTELSQITYNLPGNALVQVCTKKGDLLRERTVPVAQLGVDVALPKSMFTGNELPKIIFSEKTGNIISISK